MADADVALMMVDEAVLALSGFQLGDPLNVFYAANFANLATARLRDFLENRIEKTFADKSMASPRATYSRLSESVQSDRVNIGGNEAGEMDGAAPRFAFARISIPSQRFCQA